MHKDGAAKIDIEAWWMLAVLWILYVFSLLDRYILTMLVDPIQADLGLTDFQISLILGPAFAFCYAVAIIPVGWAADRFPRRLVVFYGVVLWSFATMLHGLARSFGALLATRVSVGVGEAALSPAAYALLADRFPRERLTTASAIFQTAIKAGYAGAFILGGLLLAAATSIGTVTAFGVIELAPWQMVMMCVGAPGLFLSLLVFTFREPARMVAKKGATSVDTALWPFVVANRKALVPMLVGFALCSTCSTAITSWAPTYIGRQFGWSPLHYGVVLGALNFIAALALVFKGAIVDWLYTRGMRDAHIRFYFWLLVASLPVALTIFLVPNPYLFFAMYAVLQLVMISYAVYGNAGLALIAPANIRGRISGLFLLIVNLAGSGLGAPIVGAITDFVFHDKSKLGLSITVTLAVAMPCALIALRLSLREWSRMVERLELEAQPASSSQSSEAVR